MSDNIQGEKTGRIAMLCVTMVILGFFFLLFKAEACASCNKPSQPDVCKDEFYEISENNRYGNSHTCTPGARAEVVASPPAPKPGIMCHCINKDQPADAGQPSPK